MAGAAGGVERAERELQNFNEFREKSTAFVRCQSVIDAASPSRADIEEVISTCRHWLERAKQLYTPQAKHWWEEFIEDTLQLIINICAKHKAARELVVEELTACYLGLTCIEGLTTAKVFSIVSRFNICVDGVSRELRNSLFTGNVKLFRYLAALLVRCGDYETQREITQLILTFIPNCGTREGREAASSLLLPADLYGDEALKIFHECNFIYFNWDYEKFLHTVNQKNGSVVSFQCMSIQVSQQAGNLKFIDVCGVQDAPVWVNVNLSVKTLSLEINGEQLFCEHKLSDRYLVPYDIITIPAGNVIYMVMLKEDNKPVIELECERFLRILEASNFDTATIKFLPSHKTDLKSLDIALRQILAEKYKFANTVRDHQPEWRVKNNKKLIMQPELSNLSEGRVNSKLSYKAIRRPTDIADRNVNPQTDTELNKRAFGFNDVSIVGEFDEDENQIVDNLLFDALAINKESQKNESNDAISDTQKENNNISICKERTQRSKLHASSRRQSSTDDSNEVIDPTPCTYISPKRKIGIVSKQFLKKIRHTTEEEHNSSVSKNLNEPSLLQKTKNVSKSSPLNEINDKLNKSGEVSKIIVELNNPVNDFDDLLIETKKPGDVDTRIISPREARRHNQTSSEGDNDSSSKASESVFKHQDGKAIALAKFDIDDRSTSDFGELIKNSCIDQRTRKDKKLDKEIKPAQQITKIPLVIIEKLSERDERIKSVEKNIVPTKMTKKCIENKSVVSEIVTLKETAAIVDIQDTLTEGQKILENKSFTEKEISIKKNQDGMQRIVTTPKKRTRRDIANKNLQDIDKENVNISENKLLEQLQSVETVDVSEKTPTKTLFVQINKTLNENNISICKERTQRSKLHASSRRQSSTDDSNEVIDPTPCTYISPKRKIGIVSKQFLKKIRHTTEEEHNSSVSKNLNEPSLLQKTKNVKSSPLNEINDKLNKSGEVSKIIVELKNPVNDFDDLLIETKKPGDVDTRIISPREARRHNQTSSEGDNDSSSKASESVFKHQDGKAIALAKFDIDDRSTSDFGELIKNSCIDQRTRTDKKLDKEIKPAQQITKIPLVIIEKLSERDERIKSVEKNIVPTKMTKKCIENKSVVSEIVTLKETAAIVDIQDTLTEGQKILENKSFTEKEISIKKNQDGMQRIVATPKKRTRRDIANKNLQDIDKENVNISENKLLEQLQSVETVDVSEKTPTKTLFVQINKTLNENKVSQPVEQRDPEQTGLYSSEDNCKKTTKYSDINKHPNEKITERCLTKQRGVQYSSISSEKGIDSISTELGHETSTTSYDTPAKPLKRKRKLYSINDDIEIENEAVNEQFVRHNIIGEKKRSSATCYKEIEKDRAVVQQTRKRIRKSGTEKSLSPRTNKNDELFDQLKSSDIGSGMESHQILAKKFEGLSSKIDARHIAIYNCSSDSDDDFKETMPKRLRTDSTDRANAVSTNKKRGVKECNSNPRVIKVTPRRKRITKKNVDRKNAIKKGKKVPHKTLEGTVLNNETVILEDERIREAPPDSDVLNSSICNLVQKAKDNLDKSVPMVEETSKAEMEEIVIRVVEEDDKKAKEVTSSSAKKIETKPKPKLNKKYKKKETKSKEKKKDIDPSDEDPNQTLPSLIIELKPQKKSAINCTEIMEVVKSYMNTMGDKSSYETRIKQDDIGEQVGKLQNTLEVIDNDLQNVEVIRENERLSQNIMSLQPLEQINTVASSQIQNNHENIEVIEEIQYVNTDIRKLSEKIAQDDIPIETITIEEGINYKNIKKKNSPVIDLTESESEKSFQTFGKSPITAHIDDHESPPGLELLNRTERARDIYTERLTSSSKQLVIDLCADIGRIESPVRGSAWDSRRKTLIVDDSDSDLELFPPEINNFRQNLCPVDSENLSEDSGSEKEDPTFIPSTVVNKRTRGNQDMPKNTSLESPKSYDLRKRASLEDTSIDTNRRYLTPSKDRNSTRPNRDLLCSEDYETSSEDSGPKNEDTTFIRSTVVNKSTRGNQDLYFTMPEDISVETPNSYEIRKQFLQEDIPNYGFNLTPVKVSKSARAKTMPLRETPKHYDIRKQSLPAAVSKGAHQTPANLKKSTRTNPDLYFTLHEDIAPETPNSYLPDRTTMQSTSVGSASDDKDKYSANDDTRKRKPADLKDLDDSFDNVSTSTKIDIPQTKEKNTEISKKIEDWMSASASGCEGHNCCSLLRDQTKNIMQILESQYPDSTEDVMKLLVNIFGALDEFHKERRETDGKMQVQLQALHIEMERKKTALRKEREAKVSADLEKVKETIKNMVLKDYRQKRLIIKVVREDLETLLRNYREARDRRN